MINKVLEDIFTWYDNIPDITQLQTPFYLEIDMSRPVYYNDKEYNPQDIYYNKIPFYKMLENKLLQLKNKLNPRNFIIREIMDKDLELIIRDKNVYNLLYLIENNKFEYIMLDEFMFKRIYGILNISINDKDISTSLKEGIIYLKNINKNIYRNNDCTSRLNYGVIYTGK